MQQNNSHLTDITAILYLVLGVSHLVAREYLAGIAWISLSISQLLVQNIGSWSSNMFRLDRPGVILAWITYLVFAFLILHYVINLVTRNN
ncbi:MAG: hypothetical protein KME21_28460 [Desmonostoc vinosum HA7617-LM4]|jgi:hypothetical protein|nr:hypothetical protein [Desmonostoc vinosum HA7617-LM4]